MAELKKYMRHYAPISSGVYEIPACKRVIDAWNDTDLDHVCRIASIRAKITGAYEVCEQRGFMASIKKMFGGAGAVEREIQQSDLPSLECACLYIHKEAPANGVQELDGEVFEIPKDLFIKCVGTYSGFGSETELCLDCSESVQVTANDDPEYVIERFLEYYDIDGERDGAFTLYKRESDRIYKICVQLCVMDIDNVPVELDYTRLGVEKFNRYASKHEIPQAYTPAVHIALSDFAINTFGIDLDQLRLQNAFDKEENLLEALMSVRAVNNGEYPGGSEAISETVAPAEDATQATKAKDDEIVGLKHIPVIKIVKEEPIAPTVVDAPAPEPPAPAKKPRRKPQVKKTTPEGGTAETEKTAAKKSVVVKTPETTAKNEEKATKPKIKIVKEIKIRKSASSTNAKDTSKN